ncbi:hypothetical protein ES705_26455 [subsurface metagenome]
MSGCSGGGEPSVSAADVVQPELPAFSYDISINSKARVLNIFARKDQYPASLLLSLPREMFLAPPPAKDRWIWTIVLDLVAPIEGTWADFRALEKEIILGAGRWAQLTLESAGGKEIYSVEIKPGNRRVHIYPNSDLLPLELINFNGEKEKGQVTIRGLQLLLGYGTPLLPLPADPGTVLAYEQEEWRDPDFELFSWDLYPHILLMDTADYSVQDRFFKRLAFYVEKKGFRGSIFTLEELAGKHGYNAHDYRAEDLARFFNEVERFSLTREEERLENILTENGIIIKKSSGYIPGMGGIISISRSSSKVLRRHLLTHEIFHGLFFSRPGYREGCFAAWQELSPEEQEFWLLFLSWAGYDTADHYLVVNEFQAYLMQQPRRGVNYYFRKVVPGRLIESYPQEEDHIRRILEAGKNGFTRSFDRLQGLLQSRPAVKGGEVVTIKGQRP